MVSRLAFCHFRISAIKEVWNDTYGPDVCVLNLAVAFGCILLPGKTLLLRELPGYFAE